MISLKIEARAAEPIASCQVETLLDRSARPTLQAVPEAPPGHGKRSNLIDQAAETWRLLDEGTSLTRVAIAATDIPAFSLGHLLNNLTRRNLLEIPADRAAFLERLDDHVRRAGDGGLRSRLQLIRSLREEGLVPEAIADKVVKPAGTTPCMRGIASVMEERSRIPFETIISSSRGKAVVTARFETIWLLRHVCSHSLTVIGRHVGGRDHTTVLNSLNKVTIEIRQNAGYRNSIERLCEKADLVGVTQSHRILLRQASFQKG